MKLLLASLLLTAACTSELPTLPYVQLQSTDETVITPEMQTGAEIWAELGWRFETPPAGTPVCEEKWFRDLTQHECVVVISIETEADLDRDNAWGETYPRTRRTWLNPKLYETSIWNIERVVGHEVGHSLADSTFHPSDGDGIMIGTDFWLSDTDRAYMCMYTGIACD